MIPLGILGQIYAVCAAIGSIFVIGSFAIGHIGEEGGFDDGGSDGGSDFNAGEDGSGNDFGAAGDDGNFSASKMTPLASNRMAGSTRLTTGFGGFILGLFSPMNWAVYMTFFGLAGLFLGSVAPWMGVVTIFPAVAFSLLVSTLFKAMTRYMMKNMHSSSHSKESDLLGQIAEVNVPIHDGRTGEVTYIIHSKRINASAQPAKPGIEFNKGAKVLIVGSKDHMVFVEACDADLEDQFIS